MLYDTVRNPAARNIPPKDSVDPVGLNKDTIETTQQRLNREVLEKFQNTSSRLPHQTFVVAMQAGKYLFLAIMIPPYICLYGIPRWLLMDALPQFFILAKTEVLRVGRFFAEMTKRVVDLMVGLIDQMIGDTLRAANQTTRNLFGFLAKGARGVIKLGQQVSEAPKNIIAYIQNQASQALSQLRSWAKDKVQKAIHFQQKVLEAAAAVINTIVYPIELIDKSILRPTFAWVAKHATATSRAIKKTYASAVRHTTRTLEKVYRPLAKASKAVSNFIVEHSRQAYQYAMQQMTNWLKPKWEAIERARDKTARLVAKVNARIKSKAADLASSTSEFIQNNIHVAYQFVIQIPSFAWWTLAPTLKRQWGRFRHGVKQGMKFYKGFCSFVASAAQGIAGQGRKLAKHALGLMRLIGGHLKYFLIWLIKQLLLFPRKLFRFLVLFIKTMMTIARTCIYGVRLLAAWTWVISGYTLVLLRELIKEVGHWAEFKPNSSPKS